MKVLVVTRFLDQMPLPIFAAAAQVLEPGDASVEHVAFCLDQVEVVIVIDIDKDGSSLDAPRSFFAEVKRLSFNPSLALAVGIFQPAIQTGHVQVAIAVNIADCNPAVTLRLIDAEDLVLDPVGGWILWNALPVDAGLKENRNQVKVSVFINVRCQIILCRRRAILEPLPADRFTRVARIAKPSAA